MTLCPRIGQAGGAESQKSSAVSRQDWYSARLDSRTRSRNQRGVGPSSLKFKISKFINKRV